MTCAEPASHLFHTACNRSGPGWRKDRGGCVVHPCLARSLGFIGSGPCLPFISSALRPRWTYRSFRMKPTKTGARLLRARATRIGNDYDASHRRRPSARLARRPFGEIPSPLLLLWAGLSGGMPATSKVPFRRLTGLSCPRQKHGIGKPYVAICPVKRPQPTWQGEGEEAAK